MRHPRSARAMHGRKKQAGIGLIELSISLVIGAAVVWGVFYLVNNAQAKRVTTEEAQRLTMMANDLQAKFQRQGSFAGLTTTALIQLGIPPDAMIDGNALRSGHSTPVVVAAANVNGQANDGFTFTYNNWPAKFCSDLVMSAAESFARVSIAGTVVKNVTTGNSDGTISVVDLTACEGSDGIVSSIVFSKGR